MAFASDCPTGQYHSQWIKAERQLSLVALHGMELTCRTLLAVTHNSNIAQLVQVLTSHREPFRDKTRRMYVSTQEYTSNPSAV